MADTTGLRGGPRPGAGRKPGSRHAEPTTVVRLPIDIAAAARRTAEARGGSASGIGGFLSGEVRLTASSPLVTASVACGFPSPAEDSLERPLDMNELHGVGNPGVFFVNAHGESMIGRHIFHGDILTMNRMLEPRHGCIIVGCLNGEFTLKTYIRHGNKVILQAENPAFANIEVPELAEFFVWGVVTAITRMV